MAIIPLDPPDEYHTHSTGRGKHGMRWLMTRTGRFYLRCTWPDCNVVKPDPLRRYADPGFFQAG